MDVVSAEAMDDVPKRPEWELAWGPVAAAKHMKAVFGRSGRVAGGAVDTNEIAQVAAEGIDSVAESVETAEVPYKILRDMGEVPTCQGEEAEVCRQAEPLVPVVALLGKRIAAVVVALAVGNRADNRRGAASSQPCWGSGLKGP